MICYNTKGSCARQILFDVKDGVITDLKFVGGCSGNSRAVAALVMGRQVDEVIALLKGINCRNGTSCPDQLAQALEPYRKSDEA